MSEAKMISCQFTPKPNPLAVGESGEICLQVQKTGAEKKNVRELLLTVPCGKGADFIFQSVSGTVIQADEPERWECGREAALQERSVDTPAYFHIRSNKEAGDPMGSPAVFRITGKVVAEPGNVLIDIMVTFADGTTENGSAYITKGDGELYLENFLARSKDKTEVPTAVFKRKEPIYLSWNSNGDFFRLYASGVAKPLAETTDTAFVVEAGAEEDTTYILQATKPSASSICLYRTLAIHIQDPSLESLEIRKELKTDSAALTVLGEPSVVSLRNVGQYFDWMLMPETDGYIVGNLAFQAGVEGNASLTVSECTAVQEQCYEVSDMAFQGKVSWTGMGGECSLSKKASLCVPVKKGIMVSVRLRIFYISESGKYDLDIRFLPFGKGRAVEFS